MSTRILIIDDEANIRRMVGALLKSEGFEVAEDEERLPAGTQRRGAKEGDQRREQPDADERTEEGDALGRNAQAEEAHGEHARGSPAARRQKRLRVA